MNIKLNSAVRTLLRHHKLVLFIVGAPDSILHIYVGKNGHATLGRIRTNNCKSAVIRNCILTTIEADKFCRYTISTKGGGIETKLINSNPIENFLAHDVVSSNRNLLIANTNYSCISKINLYTGSVAHIFKPFFITKLTAEDRTHLNGFAWRGLKPVYISALGQTDKHRAWKKNILNGGIILDVKTNKVAIKKLNMPHSPRIYRGNLYFVTSGDGRLVRYDAKHKTLETIITLPYFVRGLEFFRNFALIGISTQRYNEKGAKRDAKGAGVAVVDLKRRELIDTVTLPIDVKEVYNVYAYRP